MLNLMMIEKITKSEIIIPEQEHKVHLVLLVYKVQQAHKVPQVQQEQQVLMERKAYKGLTK